MRHGLVWMRTLAAEVEMTYWLELEVSRVRPLTPLANVKPVGFGTAWTRTESAGGNEMPTFGEKLVSLALTVNSTWLLTTPPPGTVARSTSGSPLTGACRAPWRTD